MINPIGFDYETHRIGPGAVVPPPVCLSTASREGEDWQVDLFSKADGDLDEGIEELLFSEEVLVGHNTAFDLAVACVRDESLFTPVFEKFLKGQIKDTQIREQLLDLAEHGEIGMQTLPSGKARKVTYSLARLTLHYLGIDISEGKEQDDAWRLNYDALEETPVEDWPEEAVDYAVMDSLYAVRVYEAQEIRRASVAGQVECDPLAVEDFRTMANFCLLVMTRTGVRIDKSRHDKIAAMLERELDESKFPHLISMGFMTPAQPAMPYANGAKNKDGTPKLKKAQKAKIKQKLLKEFVAQHCEAQETKVAYTPKGQVSVGADWLNEHYHTHPALEEYHARQKLQKLVTTELPRMQWPNGSGNVAPVVHANFSVLKKTGRTSSFAGKLFPSFNGQNVDPRVRECFVPRPGYVFYSDDYSAMELCTLAQKCLNLFGHSKLADAINAGYDVHAYLGAQLAIHLDEDFGRLCEGLDADEAYQAFKGCQGHADPKVAKFYKHWRKFAKPTGLGYPGGLGAKTFITFARGTYGVTVDMEMAKVLKEIWLNTYPEMRLYFDWINKRCKDPYHLNDEGKSLYRYRTPYGMVKSAATYCQIANGAGLQAFSAEGAISGLCEVVRQTYDPSCDGILRPDERGARHRPLLFIHDEIVGEAREDVAHEVAHEVASIMVDSLAVICPDVKITVEPALMSSWQKSAESVYEDGRLVVWEP